MPASEPLRKWQWLNHLMAHRPRRPDWKPTTLAVLTVIYNYADQHGANSHPGDKRIAEAIGAKERAVQHHRAILVDLNLIECTRRATSKGEAAVWRLVPPSQWKGAEEVVEDDLANLPEPEWLGDDDDAIVDGPSMASRFCRKGVDAHWWCEKTPGHDGACDLKHHR